MAKHKIDHAREERIEIEIVVDCYNESERYSAWICYLEDKLEFPFRARCVAVRKSSPLKSGDPDCFACFMAKKTETRSPFVLVRCSVDRQVGSDSMVI